MRSAPNRRPLAALALLALLAAACDDDDTAAVDAGATDGPASDATSTPDAPAADSAPPDGAPAPAADGPAPDGPAPDGPAPTVGAAIDQLAAALGGKAALAALVNERITATGRRHDPGEGKDPTKTVLVAEFSYTLLGDLAAPRYNLVMTSDTKFIIPTKLQFTEVGNDGAGYVDGADNIFNPTPAKGAIPSARLTSRLRHSDLASPLRLARKLLLPGAAVTLAEASVDGKPHKVLALDESGRATKIFIDAATGLPAKAEAMEDHPPMGDTLVEAFYSDYRDAGRLKLPYKVTFKVDGLDVHEETRSAIETDVVAAVDPFAVPAELKQAPDPAAAAFGARSAEWMLGFGHIGLSFFYAIQTAPAAPAPAELAKGVKLIVGATHNVLVVEMSDHVVAVDAPLYEEYTSAVLAQIKAAFPGKPLRRVIATHFHFDHSGGIREFAAEGNVTVTVGKPTVEFFKKVFQNPHTVDPDRLQASKVAVTVEGVDTSLTLPMPEGGELQLHRITNDHADDLLVVYLKKEKLVFQADMWNPTPAMPAAGSGGLFAKQLYQGITERNLDVATVVGAHSGSDGKTSSFSAPIAYLKVAAGL